MKTTCLLLAFVVMLTTNWRVTVTMPAKDKEVETQEAGLKNGGGPDVSEEEEGEILDRRHLFQDIFMEHLAPHRVQFGHVFEDPSVWEQRFEERDFASNRHQGKVKWGNQNGAYGEHYWDLNH